MEKKCSIIIPAYNAEKTIQQCLNHILSTAGDLFDFEIIVVNDGSNDTTAEQLKQYIDNYRIKVIHQDNAGVSSARNAGIKCATGKYVVFADADDFLHADILEKMIEVAEMIKVDLVIADYNQIDKIGGGYKRHFSNIPYNCILGKKEIKEIILHDLALGKNDGLTPIWNKLYLRSVIKKNEIIYNTSRTHGEDWDFNLQYYSYIDTFIHINYIMYDYTIDGTQLWSKYNKKMGYGLIDGYKKMETLIQRYNLLTDKEFIFFEGRFISQIKDYVFTKGVNKTDRRCFLKTKEVKKALLYGVQCNKNELSIIGYSRRDKLWMLCLYCGFENLAKKYLVKE